MSKINLIVSLDVGTTKTRAIACDAASDGLPRIVGLGIAPTHGVTRGAVVDMDATTGSIRTCLGYLQQSLGQTPLATHLSVSGCNISSQLCELRLW